MITEDLLERGLTTAADTYDVPAGGIDRIREQLTPAGNGGDGRPWTTVARWRPGARGWLALSAAAVVALIVVAMAVGGKSPVTSTRVDAGGAGGTAGSTAGGPSADSAGASTAGVAGALHAPAATPSPALRESLTKSGSGFAADATRRLAPLPGSPQRVVKTGELDLQVAKGRVGPTLDKLTGLANLEHGYIADSRTDEGGGAPSGQVTLRVPVGNFEDTVSKARRIEGAKVLSLQTSGQDVTSRYVDLQARVRALKATRATFLTLLSKATTIGETLAVQQQVTDVQTQIEQLQGQLRVLSNQTALSTLTITVDQKHAAVASTTHHKSGLQKAVETSVSRFVRGVEAIIAVIGPLLLALILVVLGWLAAKVGYRTLRRHLV